VVVLPCTTVDPVKYSEPSGSSRSLRDVRICRAQEVFYIQYEKAAF